MSTAAIYFHPEAYSTSGPRLMGRNAAGESFLRGFLLHGPRGPLWTLVATAEDGIRFAEIARESGREEPVNIIEKRNLGALAQPGGVFFPGPNIGESAWHRTAHGDSAWSLCGITHTTSSARAMDALVDLITAPVQPWDAVICTSSAVKNNVERLLQAQVDYLARRLGVQRLVLPQLPVIPLGIHCEDFAFNVDQRAAARKRLGVDDETVVVLFVGRLAFHAKAHPLAMYRGIQEASARTHCKVLIVECGWHANTFISDAFEEAARAACPDVQRKTLDGRDKAERETAWAGADIFCSLSDNIQETFGIVPIEAMAAGLPVVVSDWDGYRDTVRDGLDGFRIPTLMPQSGLGGDLAIRHALEFDTYDMYCGHTCTLVAVDVPATSQAFSQLFASADLRREMGECGRRHAQTSFDWSSIIPHYEALWALLSESRLRGSTQAAQPLKHPWPARLDPFFAFASYPTQTLAPDTVLTLVDPDVEATIRRLSCDKGLKMVNYANFVLPNDVEARAVVEAAALGPRPAAELVGGVSADRRGHVFRGLAWMVKMGALRRP
jgi:glycosyltransferase involved in cell wall biosynthesis